MDNKNCNNINCTIINPQPISNFGIDKRKLDGHSNLCKICRRNKDNNYYKNNKLTISNRRKSNRKKDNSPYRKQHLKNKYNISEKEYNMLLKKQNYGCAICGEKESRAKHLAVDHCHTTGKVRGLLCQNHNLMLGYAKDNVDLLKNAIDYLTKREDNE